jgi:hypothetical protein
VETDGNTIRLDGGTTRDRNLFHSFDSFSVPTGFRAVFENEGLVVSNNLFSGPGMSVETDSEIVFSNNLLADLTDSFVDPEGGNLHLLSRPADVVDRGRPLAEVPEDIDGERRDAAPDLGADEKGTT